MKKILTLVLSFVVIGMFAFAGTVDAATHVKSYVKKSGTYVASHYRSTANHTKIDNWSTKGNYNPYTGKKGTKK